MNKFKLAQIAADYAADRHQEALKMLQEAKFKQVAPANLNSFLRWCITTTKNTDNFYQSIKRSVESFKPYFVQLSTQKGTILRIYTFDHFKTFWVLQSDLNSNTKRLLKKWESK